MELIALAREREEEKKALHSIAWGESRWKIKTMKQ